MLSVFLSGFSSFFPSSPEQLDIYKRMSFLANLIYIKGWVFFLSQMNIMDTPIYSKEFFSFFSSFLPFLNKLFGQPNIFKRRMNFLSVSLFFVFFLPFFLFPGPERTNVRPRVLTLFLFSLHMAASTCSLDRGNARICPLNFFLSGAGLLNLWTLDLWEPFLPQEQSWSG